MSPQTGSDSFDLNVISTIRLAQRLTPGMIERGWGRYRQHFLGRRHAAVRAPARIR